MSKKLIPFWFLLALLTAVLPALAASPETALTRGETLKVTETVDGDTVRLETGREVRLLSIQAPKLPLNRPNFPTWPLAPEAKAYLEKLTQGAAVTLYYGTTREDRHGRILAHLMTSDGKWIEAEMVKAGLARVYSFADNRLLVRELLTMENEARQAKRGIWQNAYYAVRNAKDPKLAQKEGRFEIVEGMVADVAEVKKNYYINFGEDWREDFTIFIPLKARKSFTEDKIKIKGLAGRKLRVRGWVESRNGASIEVTHPEQIEFLN